MRRVAVFGWCIAGFVLSCFGGLHLTRFLLEHFVFDIPYWLSVAIQRAIHWKYPDYDADALDIEVACTWLMFFASTLFVATIIAIAGVIVWRRYRKLSVPR